MPESGSVEETWLWNLESALFVRIDKDVLIMETYQGKGTCHEGREESYDHDRILEKSYM